MQDPTPVEETSAGPFSRVIVYADEAALSHALAAALVREVEQAIECGPRAVMLSGGSTPLAAYKQLANVSWSAKPAPLFGFLSDERYVPTDDPDFNFSYAEPFLRTVNSEPGAHLALDPTIAPEEAARVYGNQVGALIERAAFDQGFLGMGADGHTAGLFTSTQFETPAASGAVSLHRPDDRVGITLSADLIVRARNLAFVVGGQGKRRRLREICQDPSSAVAGLMAIKHGKAELWTDSAAWSG